MNTRGGAWAQVVSSPPFPLIGVRSPIAPKPLICMAAFEAVYSFRLLLVCMEGRNVNQIFQPVRKSAQRVANGTRFVRGGCSGVFPAVGILSNKLPGKLFSFVSIFLMSERANQRQPGKPATELRSIEREGVLYEGKQEGSGKRRR